MSKKGRDAWERAGSPDPVYVPTVDGVARAMGLSLTFLDNRKKRG